MLDKPVDEIVTEDSKLVGVRSGSETARCNMVICDPTYAQDRCHKVGQVSLAVTRVGNIDIDVDIIDDTFDVSILISTILSYKSIDRGIDDTLLAFFIDITSILLN